jgi:hypothetical protein
MIPILGEGAGLDPLGLDEALESGVLEVHEMPGRAVVGAVEARNRGPQAVLALAGEELVGARQNRILNTSAWLPAGSCVSLPVSCVEQGRWHPQGGDSFRSGQSMYLPRSKARHIGEVTFSYRIHRQARADQGRVWQDVESRLTRARLASPTRQLHALYDSQAGRLERFQRELPLQPGQRGFAFLSQDRFLGLEVFCSHAFCGRVLVKHLRSYGLEALGLPPRHERSSNARLQGMVQHLLTRLIRQVWRDYPGVGGQGRDLRLSGRGLQGAALEVEDRLAHLGVFPN